VKDPENELDVANKRYVDSKSNSNDGWTSEGNALQSDGKMGTLNDNSATFIRNNILKMAFLTCEGPNAGIQAMQLNTTDVLKLIKLVLCWK